MAFFFKISADDDEDHQIVNNHRHAFFCVVGETKNKREYRIRLTVNPSMNSNPKRVLLFYLTSS